MYSFREFIENREFEPQLNKGYTQDSDPGPFSLRMKDLDSTLGVMRDFNVDSGNLDNLAKTYVIKLEAMRKWFSYFPMLETTPYWIREIQSASRRKLDSLIKGLATVEEKS